MQGNVAGARRVLAVAAVLLAIPAAAASRDGRVTYSFCGLARTVNGFDLVDARRVGCPQARSTIARVERGERGVWNCSRAVSAVFELRCQAGRREVRVLERVPFRHKRAGAPRCSSHIEHSRISASTEATETIAKGNAIQPEKRTRTRALTSPGH